MKRIELSLAALVVLFAAQSASASYVAAVTADSPVAYWRLNETTGTTASPHISSIDGTYTNFGGVAGSMIGANGPRPASFNGFEAGNNAPHFDRTDTNGSATVTTADYIDFGNPTALQITGDLTLEAWVFLDSYSTGNVGVAGRWRGRNDANSANVTERAYVLAINSSGLLNFNISTSGSFESANSITAMGNAIPLNAWTHVVGVYDSNGANSSLSLYINGALIDTPKITSSTAITANPGSGVPFRVGTQFNLNDGATFVDGLIDEVAVYNTALSGDRVLAHYNAAVPEPSSWLLLGCGGLGLLALRRRG